jgi:16S rRNA (guanine527-N7)-methyltransferase
MSANVNHARCHPEAPRFSPAGRGISARNDAWAKECSISPDLTHVEIRPNLILPRMQPSRIAELLAPFLAPASLSPTQLQAISTYVDLLLRWNARINLTAIRNPEEIVTRHFGESLFAARQLFPTNPVQSASGKGPRTAADIGSGAGFPGIPIKLWQPNLNLTLIESNHKKAAFLREVGRALELENVEVIADRAETIADRTFDLVTLRAVDKTDDVLPTAAKLLRPGGRMALFLTSRQVDAVRSSLPLKWEPEIAIPHSDSRLLLIGVNQVST